MLPMLANISCWFTATPSCWAKIAICPLNSYVKSSAFLPLIFADFINWAPCSLVNLN